ncbi:MAG: hypothetical protein GXY32_09475 [Ruminococcaceae bacterium]|nr:hypothetical protein [Oscillospiraceae bacterium]
MSMKQALPVINLATPVFVSVSVIVSSAFAYPQHGICNTFSVLLVGVFDDVRVNIGGGTYL